MRLSVGGRAAAGFSCRASGCRRGSIGSDFKCQTGADRFTRPGRRGPRELPEKISTPQTGEGPTSSISCEPQSIMTGRVCRNSCPPERRETAKSWVQLMVSYTYGLSSSGRSARIIVGTLIANTDPSPRLD